ncbi:flagellar basal-body rod protein FlgF [bacterium]|nr:flagellar basal-body rod protein FlgF [bacterium]
MIKGIYQAAAGLLAESKAHEVRANNLANVSTVGYKKDTPFFKLLVAADGNGGVDGAKDPQDASCVSIGGTAIDFSQGGLRHTGNPLDLTIEGSGFFAVQMPNQEAYTRAGNFRLSPEGKLTDQSGYPVLGLQGELVIPAGGVVEIDSNGEVFVDRASVGSLKIVDFEDKSVLRKAGNNLFVNESSVASPIAAKSAEVNQGFLEMSNSNVIEEMVSMIDGMRHFESHQKAIQSMLSDSIGKMISTLPHLQ